MLLSHEELRGRTVIDAAGAVLGRVESIVFATDLTVDSMRVKLRDDVAQELGIERRGLLQAPVIDLPRDDVQAIGDAVVLRVRLTELASRREAEVAAARAPTPTPPPG
jgi:sporulation protein YlmC with PRC-barrel domain